jgi:hypothetical protein
MAKELIVHAGFHKTGTTALQSALFAVRDKLEKRGFTYPVVGGKAHHKAIYSLMEKGWGWEDRGGNPVNEKKWPELVKKVKRAKQSAIISSEFLCELNEAQIAKFKQDLGVEEVTIYFTLRPLLKIVPSAYQQHLKIGIRSDYEKWLHSILDEPGVSTITPSFWVRHQHAKVLKRWIDAYGKDCVKLVIVDEKNPDFMYQVFNEALGLKKPLLAEQKEKDSNRSLTLEEVALLRKINKIYPKKRSWHDYETFIRQGSMKYLTNKVKPSDDAARLQTPEWAVAKIKEISNESVHEIKSLGIEIIGDIDSFESATIPIGVSVEPDQIPVEVAARALVAMDLRVVETFPTKWMIAKTWKMIKRDIKKWLK